MNGRRRRALLLGPLVGPLVVALVAGCSLPLPGGVREVGDVSGEARQGLPLQVIPPGPRAGASPTEAVLGFLGAQASSVGGHEIARRFLAPAERPRWDDDAEVQVYDPDRLQVAALPGGSGLEQVVRVTARVTGTVRTDGSYLARANAVVTEDYRVQRVLGEWRLRDVPDGLRLTEADLQRAYRPRHVYYLAPGEVDDTPHLVPDLVFLPDDGDLAATLVERLLRAPSQSLAGSVRTAVPAGMRLRRAALSGAGVATVELVGGGQRPTGRGAQDLSAQLVWTLRAVGSGFRSLRLTVDGQPLSIPGVGAVQDAQGWESYDPEGLGPTPPYLFTSARRLRASIELPPNPATAGDVGEGDAVPVDVAALTPDRTTVALLDTSTPRDVVVRVGPLRGSAFPVVARSAGLSSPSWGSGDHGLWLLRGGREVVRVDGGLRRVTVLGLPDGQLRSLAVSRDGARVALVAGGRLYVGRVELQTSGPRVVGLTQLVPSLREGSQVVWESSTRLVVLSTGPRAAQLLRVTVDGSSVRTLNTAGLTPTAVAAAPVGVVVTSGGRLYLDAAGGFRLVQTDASRAPAFPG